MLAVALPQSAFIPATSDMRSRRADDTNICVTHAENAGSLICKDESEIHFDSSDFVNDICSFGETSEFPTLKIDARIITEPVLGTFRVTFIENGRIDELNWILSLKMVSP